MKYSQKAALLAQQALDNRRNQAEQEQRERFIEVKALAPQIEEIEKKIKSVNFELLKAAFTNKSEQKKASEIVMQIKENNRLAHMEKEQILKSIGFPTDYLDVKYHCMKCMDSGYSDGVRCECLDKLLKEYTYSENTQKCDIKLHDFDEFRLEYYPIGSGNNDPHKQMSMILNQCITYANNFSEKSDSLLMLGNTGLGKTFLCSCIAKRVVENGKTVVFRSILKVFEDALAEHYGKKDGDTLKELQNADLVILDDLGSEFSSQSDPILYQILNDRINLEKPTIITTNMSIQQLNKRYNERIISRLFGDFELLPFVGNDIRLEKRQNG